MRTRKVSSLKRIFLMSLISLSVVHCSPKLTSTSLSLIANDATLSHPPDNQDIPKPPVIPPVNPPTTKPTEYMKQIMTYAGQSTCRQFSFESRGRAPAGYLKGMSLSYARSLCRARMTGPAQPGINILKAPSVGNTAKDVLAHYEPILTAAGFRIQTAGDDPIHATYTIGIGLGMRESSGRYCVGWDVAAGADRASAEAEAGLFQASLDSMRASPELQKIYETYRANPRLCLLDVYKEGASCSAQSILGTGAGAEFQEFTKKCPAFAAEYTMTLIRIVRSHFGPLNRQTAQIVPVCESMLTFVRQLVNQDPEGVCNELL